MPRGRPKHHPHDEENGSVAVLEDRRRNPALLPVSDKVQPFDPAKGYDMTKYDMRRGEIGIPSLPHPHPAKVPPLPANQSTGLCVECGKPVAPGQNYVCRNHIKAS